jgi:hypothetical protein
VLEVSVVVAAFDDRCGQATECSSPGPNLGVGGCGHGLQTVSLAGSPFIYSKDHLVESALHAKIGALEPRKTKQTISTKTTKGLKNINLAGTNTNHD